MINLGPNAQAAAPVVPVSSVKIFGVGGAGLAMLASLAELHLDPAELVAVSTDAQALMNAPTAHKIQIGRESTKGLGAGGDPSLGEAAARENTVEIREECADAQVVVVCAGLGGGTGSGAAPVVAKEAHDKGALVIGVVTLPLGGEGGKRRDQAAQALRRLARSCTAVLCFENDRMNDLGPEGTTITAAFTAASRTLATAVASVVRMVSLPAILRLGVDELTAVFQDSGARCEFGCGFSSGPDRALAAVEEALRSPLLEGGKLLSGAENVLVHITGDSSLKLTEVHSALHRISSHVDESAQIMLGVALDPADVDVFGVVIMASTAHGMIKAADTTEADDLGQEEPSVEGAEEDGNPSHRPPSSHPSAGKAKARTTRKAPPQPSQQEELPLDQAVRGRFKGMGPTMVDGQDLDVPTFIRLQIRLE